MGEKIGAFDWAVSRLLLLLGLGFLLMGLSKPLLLSLGARAPGRIVSQEGGVSTRGAYGVRYRFTTKDGRECTGTAFTASKDARFARVAIAYFTFFPELNMPAYGGYAAITGLGWGLGALLALGVGRALGRPRSATSSVRRKPNRRTTTL